MSQFSIHNVSSIRVSVDSSPLDGGGFAYWQTLKLFDSEEREIGQVVMFLERPEAALPLGDEPPYWGSETAINTGLDVDGTSPF